MPPAAAALVLPTLPPVAVPPAPPVALLLAVCAWSLVCDWLPLLPPVASAVPPVASPPWLELSMVMEGVEPEPEPPPVRPIT